MKTIALIDYGSGNLHSAARALRVASNEAKKTREIRITHDPAVLQYADRIVLPGVGHFADCAANLRKHDGLIEGLEEAVLERGVPFLGIPKLILTWRFVLSCCLARCRGPCCWLWSDTRWGRLREENVKNWRCVWMCGCAAR